MGNQEQNINKHSEFNKISSASGGQALTTLFFYLTILFFIIGFSFTDTPTPFGWYQQFMPNLNGRQITDVTFLDSLTGWAVTNSLGQNDSAYVIKTTNGGDNWFILYRKVQQFTGYNKIYFINQNTGYTCGVSQFTGISGFNKSTDGGTTWSSLNVPDPTMTYNDMSILNIDTAWLVASSNPTGGIFLTANGGVSWQQQLSAGAANPDKIYMFNARIGYANRNNGTFMYKTTNSGLNWAPVAGTDGFTDIYFTDSLTGWKAFGTMKKTTNGGTNWITEPLPSGGIIVTTGISKFSNVNKDTIWGVGGWVFYNGNGDRGILYRTTNSGNNWQFQIPDTSIHIPVYRFNEFVNKLNGWAYNSEGIHTTTGGDTTFLVPVKQISNQVPKEYKLYQNYPNPFNPRTVISYQLRVKSYVKLAVYNIQGKEIAILVNQKQTAGSYEADFSGNGLSSGVYFYQLTISNEQLTEVYRETRKMILIK